MWSGLPALLAASTSVHGSILKIDSTKKVCKKLQGAAANTASWATNVANERGEVVVSVLTESEGDEALRPMANGLMDRYERAAVDPPLLLYTDKDCCCQSDPSKYQVTTFIILKVLCVSNTSHLLDFVLQMGWAASSSRHLALHEEVGQRMQQ